MGPRVLAEPVRVGQTITVGITQTCSLCSVLREIVRSVTQTFSLCSVLREIVRSVSHIHSNLKEHTLLPLVVENHALVIVEQLFHDRTSKHVKYFTL